jgi:hypothetical protein
VPYKDRQTRLDYLRRWKLKKRPAPQPIPQSDAELTPRGMVEFSPDGTKVRCHCCGGWYGALNTHMRLHGLDAKSYKDLYDLPRTASLWPPAVQAKQRDAALARDQGSVGRNNLPHDGSGRPPGQDARLGVRIAASRQRQGIYTRGGNRT